jgi:hypothetical protein
MRDYEENKIRLSGDETETAIKDWMKEEYKTAPRMRYDLGKFCFTVSAASTGVLISLLRPNAGATNLFLFAFSLLALTISEIFSLLMAIPTVKELRPADDLLVIHRNTVSDTKRTVITWCICWFIAMVTGFLSFLA